MPASLLILIGFLLNILCLQAQSVYELSYWSYRRAFLGIDTNSAKAKRDNYSLEIYDEQNRLVALEEYYNDGTLKNRNRYIFNEAGQLETELYGNYEKDSIRHLKKFTYNERGLLHTAQWLSRDKMADYPVLETYYYDTLGRLVQKTETSGRYPTQTRIFSYKDLPDGHERKTVLTIKGSKKKWITTAHYNSKGLETLVKTRNKVYKTSYQYNDKGEWTTRKIWAREGSLMPWVCDGEWRRAKVK